MLQSFGKRQYFRNQPYESCNVEIIYIAIRHALLSSFIFILAKRARVAIVYCDRVSMTWCNTLDNLQKKQGKFSTRSVRRTVEMDEAAAAYVARTAYVQQARFHPEPLTQYTTISPVHLRIPRRRCPFAYPSVQKALHSGVKDMKSGMRLY